MAGCPSCGAVPASPDSRFCDRCGSPLGAASGAAHQGAQARKVVTVLFADLVGSTATQEGMDPESVRRWLDRYYAVVRGEIEGRGGRVVKFIGDGVMAVFGVPEVREDDADRAVAAARAMQGAVAELGGPGGAPGVGLRVGVNTGEVVVTTDDDDVVGDVVNVAARLEQAARPGEVLVGEATFRLVRTRAQLRAVAPLELKGKSEPVPAFLLQSLERSEEDASTSPFVGRAGELERLTAVLDVAIGDRHPQMASVVGSPGVGKSRLVRELGAAAADRARVVVVRCDPAGGATFAPVATALRAAASLDDDASDETVLAGLTALFDEDEPDRNRIARSAAAVLGVGEPGLPEETFWAVRRLVENAANRRPMVFVFEDVHWAEPLLLDLIEHLATYTRDLPLLLVLTARPELREQRPALVEVGGRVTAAIHLEGLAVDESRRLTRALLDGASLPAALLDRVAAASEGNPLFVRELVRMLVDDGVLKQSDAGWTASVDARTVEVPLSIHAVLAARIDRLPPAEQEVLGAASILGRTFARGAVLHLVDAAVGEHLDEHLEGLRRKELVERAGTQWLDEPQLRFHHALVQDAAYRRLLKEVRADLHERAAQWLEAKVGELAEHDDLIGFQLEQAHLLRGEAGLSGDDLGRSAALRLRAAGRRSLEADDRPGAAGLLGRALACLPDDDPGRADILIERCEALLSMGDVTEAAPAVAALAAVAPGDARLEGWAACFEGELANLRDPRHLGDTVLRAEGAAASLDALGDHAGAAKAHAVRAASLARLGRIGECEQALDEALGAARAAGDRRRATAILAGAPSAALWGPNPVTRASGRCLDVVRVLRITSRAPAVEAISLRCQAVLEALRGRDDAARRMLASARTALEELGHALGLIEVDLASGMVETLAGDLERASAHLERAMAGFHELGIDVDAGLAAALLARVRIAQGMPTEALELTRESERLGGDDLKTSIAWRSVRAAALADEGDLTEARRLAEEAVALAEPTDALVDHADALVALAEVLAHAGDEPGSVAAALRAVELYERKEASVPAANARWLLGDAPVQPAGPPTRRDEARDRVRKLPATAAVGLADRMAELLMAEDWTGFDQLFAADAFVQDHRPLVGAPPLHRDRLAESFKTVVDMGIRDLVLTILGTRGDELVLGHVDFLGSEGDAHIEVVTVVKTGGDATVEVMLVFDVERQAEAWAELERLYCGSLPPDQAEVWRVGSALLLAMCAHDWDAMAQAMAEEVVCVDHRPSGWGTVARDEFVELYRGAVALAPDAWFGFHDVLAITDRAVVGEAAGIGRTVDGGDFRTAATAVLQVAAGQITHVDYFPADRVDLAMDLVEELDADGMSTVERAWRRLMDSAIATEWDAVRACLAPDAVYEDRRAFGTQRGPVGVDEIVVELQSLVAAGLREFGLSVAAPLGELGGVFEAEYIEPDRRDGLAMLTAVACRSDGTIEFAGNYDLDQLDRAITELRQRIDSSGDHCLADLHQDELSTDLTEADRDPGLSLHDLDTDATRRVREMHEVLLGSDIAACSAVVAEDMVCTDDRPVLGGYRIEGRDAFAQAMHSLVELGVTHIDNHVLAVRGERLCLCRGVHRGVSGVVAVLQVFGFDDDGLMSTMDVFEVDALDAAVELLDERYLAGEGRAVAETLRVTLGFMRTLGERDLTAVEAFLADDLVYEDHRPLGFGRLDRAAYLASMPPAWESSSDIRWLVRRLFGTVGGSSLGSVDVFGTGAGGELHTPLLGIPTVRDGKIQHLEIFPIDERAAAEARFAELTAEPGSNLAVEVITRTMALLLAGRVEEAGARYGPDIVMEDHRPIIGGVRLEGRDAFEPMASAIVDWGFDRWTWSVVALHGDHLALVRAVFGDGAREVEALLLAEADDQVRYRRLDIFDADQLELAQSVFVERAR